ncbi:RNA-directed DNA polymerase from mobile element jockey [Eumeta japonica]|uniref:RNA-directed DNA polymerase from mobile element jockey n=1 Tax=Eumeta variegata TaxID=151549 RepID=A0A4C1Y3S6_EUMVA|nr:RNA-directed DNA polymerase from mobile element jockey [Eumeta japonica]
MPSQVMVIYERSRRTVEEGVQPFTIVATYCCLIVIPLINMESTDCRLAVTDQGVLVIVSVYFPSPKRLLRRDLRALLALGYAVVLFGDFNCKSTRWGCPNNNCNGNKLDRFEDRLDLEIIALSTATYIPDNVRNRPSTLDIVPTKGVALN